MDTTRGLLKLMQQTTITMDILLMAMVTPGGLQKLKQRLKLSTITMDITPRRVMGSRKVTAPLMVATTKGLLKLSTITMDITPRTVMDSRK